MVISNKRKFCFSVVRTPFSTKFLAKRSLTFFSWYFIFKGFHVSPIHRKLSYKFVAMRTQIIKSNIPLKYSIQLCIVSGGLVSLICLRASSKRTSPVGVSFFIITFLICRLFLRMPAFSNSILCRRASSTSIHPRRPDEIESFQKDV